MNPLVDEHIRRLVNRFEEDEKKFFLQCCRVATKEEFIEQLQENICYSFIVINCRGDIAEINAEIDMMWYEYAGENDILYDGFKSVDKNGNHCYWDDYQCKWISKYADCTPRFMEVLNSDVSRTFEGFSNGADDCRDNESDGETTHEDFDIDTVICKSCKLPFYDLLDDGPFCTCENT